MVIFWQILVILKLIILDRDIMWTMDVFIIKKVIKNSYGTFYHKIENLPGTLYRITFNKYKYSLRFLEIIGHNDYEINIYKADDTDFGWGNPENELILNLCKNPDNFYEIPETIYNVSFSKFKNNLSDNIENNFDNIKPYNNNNTTFMEEIKSKIEGKQLYEEEKDIYYSEFTMKNFTLNNINANNLLNLNGNLNKLFENINYISDINN